MPDEKICECCGIPMKVASEISFEVQEGGLWTAVLHDYMAKKEIKKEKLAPSELLNLMREWGVDDENIALMEQDVNEARTSM